MGKRSGFARRPQDAYDTPDKAVDFLMPFLHGVKVFAEPCVGNYCLSNSLVKRGLKLGVAGDIKTGSDALKIDWAAYSINAIITNPPWTREILHPMIEHFQRCVPTWLLFDADWAHTIQAGPYLDTCSAIVSVGRLRWIEGSKHTGKDNAAWYRFDATHWGGPRFFGRGRQ